MVALVTADVVALRVASGVVPRPLVTPADPETGVACAELTVDAVVFVRADVLTVRLFVVIADVALVIPFTAGVVLTVFVIGVAVVFEIAAVVFVRPAVVAVGAATVAPVATVSPPPPPPPVSAPETTAGFGAELIEELTVTCGFAAADGGMNWPVTCCRLFDVFVPSAGAAWPRYLPLKASSAFSVARASSDAEIPLDPDVVVAPDDEPGVDVAFGATEPAAGALIAGSPLPGILFVEQPNAANEPVSAIAARIRRPGRSLV